MIAGCGLPAAGCRLSVLTLLIACHADPAAPPAPTPTKTEPTKPAAPVEVHTVNQFYALGTPTFVAGPTTRGQAAMIRALAFPTAELVDDTAIAQRGWPARPIVYGGAHTNAAVAALHLPLTVTAGHLAIGDRTFDGDDLALVAVIPADAAHPELLLYAGTGTPGIAEINTAATGDAAITIADAFGPLVTGTWKLDGANPPHAELGSTARRVGWREIVPPPIHGVAARFRFWDGTKPSPADDAVVAACTAGVATSVDALGGGDHLGVTIYLHPDRGSKRSLTGNAGDGHAKPFARALHVVGDLPPAGLQLLVAHEVTHVLGAQTWGQPGSPLFAEGLAVWVAGQYGGQTLDQLKPPSPAPPIRELIGPVFRKLPERDAYAYGALLVRAAIARLGLAAVRDHLYGATATSWADACKAAGTTPAEMDALLAAAVR